MPTMPCHSTAWQIDQAGKAPGDKSSGNTAAWEAFDTVRAQRAPAEPLPTTIAADAFAYTSSQGGAATHSHLQQSKAAAQSQLEQFHFPPADFALSPSDAQLPFDAHTEAHKRLSAVWALRHSISAEQPAYSNSCDTDSAEAWPEVVPPELGVSPGSRASGSLGTMESLDSASALQPQAATFAQLLQQQNERAARSRAALSSAGPAGTLGSLSKLSASQMARALSLLPNFNASVLTSSRPDQLLQGLSEMWGAQQAIGAESSRTSTSASSHPSGSGETPTQCMRTLHFVCMQVQSLLVWQCCTKHLVVATQDTPVLTPTVPVGGDVVGAHLRQP